MSDSYSSASVEGYEGTTGGLVGTSSGTISSSYYSGTVNNADVYSYTGGLAGYSSGAISNSYFSGTASSAGDYVGGIVGYSTASISNSHSIGFILMVTLLLEDIGILGTLEDLWDKAWLQSRIRIQQQQLQR
jgi:hypothetical protein